MTGPTAPTLGAPPPPPVAAEVFGPALPTAVRYADLLCTWGMDRGLVGPRERERIWTRHLLNAAVLAPWLPPDAQVVDIGSGAGLPGIPLALIRPDLDVTLMEPLLRRVTFLEQVLTELALSVDVVRARAEEWHGSVFDAVVARAVAPLPRLVELSAPLVRPGGVLLALKGETASSEVDHARKVLARVDASAEVHAVDCDGERTRVVCVRFNDSPVQVRGGQA